MEVRSAKFFLLNSPLVERGRYSSGWVGGGVAFYSVQWECPGRDSCQNTIGEALARNGSLRDIHPSVSLDINNGIFSLVTSWKKVHNTCKGKTHSKNSISYGCYYVKSIADTGIDKCFFFLLQLHPWQTPLSSGGKEK